MQPVGVSYRFQNLPTSYGRGLRCNERIFFLKGGLEWLKMIQTTSAVTKLMRLMLIQYV